MRKQFTDACKGFSSRAARSPAAKRRERGSDNIPAPGAGGRQSPVLLEATLSLVQKADVAGSQRLLLGSRNKTAAPQMAMKESSAPLTR